MANISDTCMLVSVSISIWSCERNDARLRKAIADKFNCTPESVRGGKYLIDPNALKPIGKIAGEMRTRNYALTLPWDDKGGRIINVNGFDSWRSEMGDFKRRIEQSAIEFAHVYPELKYQAARDLNGLYRESEYPSPEAILSKFSCGTKIQKVPEGRDFRTVALGEDDIQAIRDQIEAEKHAVVAEAMNTVALRLRTVINHMVQGLRGYDETDRKATRFHDSLVDNVRELCAIMPNLNLTGDRRIDEIAGEVSRKLTRLDAESLRANETVRIQVADAAEGVLRRMEGLGL